MYLCESVYAYDPEKYEFEDIEDFMEFMRRNWAPTEEFFAARTKNWFETERMVVKESAFAPGCIIFYTGFDSKESCDEYMSDSFTNRLRDFFTASGITLVSQGEIDEVPESARA